MEDWENWEPNNPGGPTPIGDPDCDVCKKCSCYKTCFSGMPGFPNTSSNWGKSQAWCASHEEKCGIKHYKKQTTLLDFYDHRTDDTSKEVIT